MNARFLDPLEKKFKRPTVMYPTLVRGIIHGPVRCESIDGSEIYLPPMSGTLKIKPFVLHEAMRPTEWNLLPIEENDSRFGKTFFVTHLQQKATYFSLRYSPFSYHFGKFWKLQTRKPDGTRIPNSEQGIYWRTPGWRWQVPDARSEGTPWIWSWGRVPGGHLD